jgi:hypothetical protein
MKHIASPAILALVCVSALLGTVSAYAQNQTGTLAILSGFSFDQPSAPITFPTTFIPQIGTEKTYSVLDPAVEENRISLYDSSGAFGFAVLATLSDLEAEGGESVGGHAVDYRNVSIVTLSESGAGVDATSSFNNPPGAGHVIAPAACNAWTSASGDTEATIESDCGGIMNTSASMFYERNPPPSSSTLSTVANPGDTVLEVSDGSRFIAPPAGGPAYKVRIGTDLITYEGISGNTLTGVRGIETSHGLGDLVIQHPLVSGSLTLMENTTIAETGLYEIGFALRLSIDPDYKEGDYSGTLTITYQ